MTQTRSRSRSAARLAAVQALYQQEMEGTPLPRLLKEFHDHRLGATIEDNRYHDAMPGILLSDPVHLMDVVAAIADPGKAERRSSRAWINDPGENYRDCRGGCLRRPDHRRTHGTKHVHALTNEFPGECWQEFDLPVRPAGFNNDGLTLDISKIMQRIDKRLEHEAWRF